jgi:hypothetical protein
MSETKCAFCGEQVGENLVMDASGQMACEDCASAEIEAQARELYEASRKNVSGRPAWEHLNPNDPYDMGMREHALSIARGEQPEGEE